MNGFNKIVDFINQTPKAELHLHIEGSLEPELMFKLSKRNKIEIPFKSVEEIQSAYNFTNLDSFLKIYYEGSNVLINEEDFFDLTWDYILKCKKDNIVHTEIFFDPQSHLPRGIKFDTIINGIDKQLVTKIAADLKNLKPIEPYKAKGIKERGQFVLRKEGKKK